MSAFVFSAMHRGEAVGLDSVSSRANKAVNHGLTDIGTLQQMWEQLSSRTFLKTIPPDIASPATQLSGVAGENPAQYFSP
ncbi:hypothetical protein, partial [Pseudomonas sp. zfem002]|uniref:hypothetical protein n=1 Tax=Pseudomonas sp. zfem002 TaxID=3078197 RepID=UPI00292A0C70